MGTCGRGIKTIDGKNNQENNQEINKINKEHNSKKDLKIEPKIFNGQNKIKEQENKILKLQEEKKEKMEPKRNIMRVRLRVPLNLVNEVSKSICKISIRDDFGFRTANGFFMKTIDESRNKQEKYKKYLIISEQIISKNNNYEYLELEKFNEQKKMILNLKDRHIKPLEENNLTIIEIKDTDEISNEFKFLSYNINYIAGYNIYKNGYVFSIGYSNKGRISYPTGKIINIENYEFEYDVSANECSRGSPIMILNNNTNEIRIIGIHRGSDHEKNMGLGTFIAKILAEKCKIQVLSDDQYVNTSINCINIDKFCDIEKEIYEGYPYLLKKEIHFISNGKLIDRKRTLAENRIKNGDILVVVVNEVEDLPKEEGNLCVINLISSDQFVNIIITCKDIDNFSLIEQKLYDEFPEYEIIKNNLFFLANGGVIDRSASLKENNIKNDNTIVINKIEDDD